MTFGGIEVKRSAFHKFKYPIDINDLNIGKIKTSKKCSYGKKRFEYITTMSPSVQDTLDVGLAISALVHKVHFGIKQSHHQLQDTLDVTLSKHTLWTSAWIGKPTSSASCSWWLSLMSKPTLWTSAYFAKPMSSASCSWPWLCYMSKHTLQTSACVAKLTSSASCSWWWLC